MEIGNCLHSAESDEGDSTLFSNGRLLGFPKLLTACTTFPAFKPILVLWGKKGCRSLDTELIGLLLSAILNPVVVLDTFGQSVQSLYKIQNKPERPLLTYKENEALRTDQVPAHLHSEKELATCNRHTRQHVKKDK